MFGTETRIESTPAVIKLKYKALIVARPTMWVLSVGIDEYRNPRYNLNYAVGDANGFVEAIEETAGNLFADVRRTSVTNREATREGILSAFREIQSSSKPDDLFVFFYAGHGIVDMVETQDFFFVPHNVTQFTRSDILQTQAISAPELSEILAAIPARKQFLVLDACHSGAAIGDITFAYRGAAEEQALTRLQRAQGIAMLAASREDQFAQEFSALGQGALTKAVIDGLRGAAGPESGQITVGQLLLYADEAVPQLTEEHSGQLQFPQLFLPPQDFPIGVR